MCSLVEHHNAETEPVTNWLPRSHTDKTRAITFLGAQRALSTKQNKIFKQIYWTYHLFKAELRKPQFIRYAKINKAHAINNIYNIVQQHKQGAIKRTTLTCDMNKKGGVQICERMET